MAAVNWTPRALADIEAICQFIANDAPRAAELFAVRIFQATEQLEAFPRSGRVLPELGDEQIREILMGNYRIIYLLLAADDVDILTVHHAAQLLG